MKAERKAIKIYGERNTGTNYLRKLLDLNFEVNLLEGTVPYPLNRIVRKLPQTEFLKDVYFKMTFKKGLGWKHREIDKTTRDRLRKQDSDILFMTLTKNPYSWLLSLYQRPYHFNFKEDIEFIDFLKQPCSALGREAYRKSYENPIELWNKKNRSYLELQTHSNSVYSLKYEQLVIDPIKELNKIQSTFSLETKLLFPMNYKKSTKSSSIDNNYYRDYYGNERWRRKLGKDEIKVINDKIDRECLGHFGYKLIEI